MSPDSIEFACSQAAELIGDADGLVITAGAGIGIDSGLPDFRGDAGFWNAYPALGELGVRFFEIANPKAFREMPEIAWGFYGHRLSLYRKTMPHAGFTELLQIVSQMPRGGYVFTSNVDGHFQKAGFDPGRIVECHGSIHHLQCLDACGQDTWTAEYFVPQVDPQACKLLSALPTCPSCGGVARPGIMMFGDWDWDETAVRAQKGRMNAWLARVDRPVVLEIGAGTAIPTARHFGESMDCPLIRINPSESEVGLPRNIGIAAGALDAITLISQGVLGKVVPTTSKSTKEN